MAKNDGLITRRDVISDGALNWGKEYEANISKAIKANQQLVEAVKVLNEESKKLKSSDTQKQYIAAKNAEKLATQKAIEAIKKQETAELSANKIKISSIKASEAARKAQEAATASQNRATKSKQRSTALTEAEKVANQESSKAAQLQAKANGALSSTYGRLNARRAIAAMRLADLMSAEKRNTAEIKRAQKQYNVLDLRIKAVDKALKNYANTARNTGSALSGLNGFLRQVLTTIGLMSGLALVGQVFRDIFQTIVEFDRQLIAVGKTTNIAGEDLRDLGVDVISLGNKLNGISIQGLLNTAEIAGQLGVEGSRNILAFSEAVEKLKLTSDIVSREQVQNLAKFVEVSQDGFENVDRLASVITDLGNNFATTEAQILSNATEIQKGVSLYSASAENVLGLGAATSALGAQAEASRSAIQLTFKAVDDAIVSGTGLEKILSLTKFTQEELSRQFQKDATVIFQRFIQGLKDAKDGGENLNAVLQEVGINQIRTTAVVGALASNYEVLEEALKRSTNEYRDNLALNAEVDAATRSISSVLGDVADKWATYILEVDKANQGTAKIVRALEYLRDNFSELITNLIKYSSVLLTYIVATKAFTLATTLLVGIKAAATAAELSFALATGIGRAAVIKQAIAVRAATTTQAGFNLVMAATPWGIILAAIAAVVVAYQVFNDELSDADRMIRRINQSLEGFAISQEGYNKDRELARAEAFANIEKELKLRKAQGETYAVLDKEEVDRKKAFVQTQIDALNDLKATQFAQAGQEIKKIEDQIKYNKELIPILEEVRDKAQDDGDGVSFSNSKARLRDIDETSKFEEEKLAIRIAVFNENKEFTLEEIKKLNKILFGLEEDRIVIAAKQQKEADDLSLKEKRDLMKALFDLRQKLAEDLFKLEQFRLQEISDINEEILENETSTLDQRLDAQEASNEAISTKLREELEFRLTRLGQYNIDTGKLVRELSDDEVQQIILTGKSREKLTSEQQLLYEKYQRALTVMAITEEKQRQRIIDAEVDSLRALADARVQLETNNANDEIVVENNRFDLELQAAEGNFLKIEDARIRHEQKIFNIQKRFALLGINLQIQDLESQLLANKAKEDGAQISAEKIALITADLKDFQRQASDIETENYLINTETKALAEQKFNKDVEKLAVALSRALGAFGDTLYEGKIQSLDDELSRQGEYYSDQLVMAEGDADQTKRIKLDQEKDRKRLEAEKRKAQIEQAKMNKAFALADIAFNTTKAVMAIASTGGGTYYADFGISAGVLTALTIALGSVQAATVLATPIPKYRYGREGGPAEQAMVGDGYVKEVISESDGSNPRLTPSRPTLVALKENDRVSSSVQDYNNFMREMTDQGIQTSGVQTMEYTNNRTYTSKYDKEILTELKNNTKAVKNNKNNIIFKESKIDIDHKVWASKNIYWN
jgi:hypothetical protein